MWFFNPKILSFNPKILEKNNSERFSDLPYLYDNYGIPKEESKDPETQRFQRIVAKIEDNLNALNISKIV